MRRRAFITLVGGAAASVVWPLTARAQQSVKKLPVVAFIAVAPNVALLAGPNPSHPLARAFVHGLRDLGWVEGRSVVIERRSPEGQPERAPAIFADLIARGVDVIVIGGSPLWLMHAAQAATRDIPIVAFFSSDPVVDGLIANLSRPDGNLTGVTVTTGYELFGKRLQFLKELSPGIVRVAFLGQRSSLAAARLHAASLGIAGFFFEVDRADQFDHALAAIRRERVDALSVLGGPVLYNEASRVAAFAVEHRLLTMFGNREGVEAGGLMSYGANVSDLFRQMAGYVDKILKGAKPADLPVEQPRTFELVINGRAVKALGLTIPPTLLALANAIIE